jgi:uncharacterized protein (DUF1501 family)
VTGGPLSGSFGRRRFLALAGSGAVVVAVAGCRSSGSGTVSRGSSTTTAGSSASSSPASTGPSTSTAASGAGAGAAGERILVLVQLNGGNDGLNTLVPADGRYRDARPNLAVPEAELVALPGESAYALHPSLAPLLPLWQAERLSFVESIGFPDPDRSHFVAMDTWRRAGDLTAPTGWLGRVLDQLPADPDPLFATALDSGAPLLLGTRRQPTVILRPASFDFAKGIRRELLARMADPPAEDPLVAAAQGATVRAVAAVKAFGDLADPAPAGGGDARVTDPPAREGGASLADGLATAAQLVTGDVGARIVVVSASGFDTHANQAATQKALLADLAEGLTRFTAAIDKAGMGDRVLIATTSEFGRRVQENGSGGTDHGKAGVSLLLGPVRPGIHGALDLGDLQDGDVRPAVDPRVLYTAALDWLGADPVEIIGRRYDDVPLLA